MQLVVTPHGCPCSTNISSEWEPAAMQPCEGDACDFVELWNHDSVWFVQNLHLSKSVRVEFDGIWGGMTHSVDLKPREEQILTFTEFFGNWHANFLKKD